MAIAIDRRKIRSAKRLNLLLPFQRGIALAAAFWWHTRAYSVIFVTLALALLSILLLFLHDTLRKASKRLAALIH